MLQGMEKKIVSKGFATFCVFTLLPRVMKYVCHTSDGLECVFMVQRR